MPLSTIFQLYHGGQFVVSTIKMQLSVLVKYKADSSIIIHQTVTYS
jgi:hypothetical protein